VNELTGYILIVDALMYDIGEHHRVVDDMLSNGREDIPDNRFGSDHTFIINDVDDMKHSEHMDNNDRDEPSSSAVRPSDKQSTNKNTVFKAMDRIRRRMLRIVDATRFVKSDRCNNSN